MGSSSNKKAAIMLVGLLLVLAAVVYFYYSVTKPPEPVGASKPSGYSHLFSIYYGAPGDRLYRPTEVAVDKENNIYVVDTFKHRVLIFDQNGKYLGKMGKRGHGKGELQLPSGITVDDEGRVYVLSNTENKVTIFNQSKVPVWEIEVPRPLTATIKGKKLYITTDRGVMVGDLKGNLLLTFGTKGRAKGQVNRPTGIAVDDKGNIYLADSMNYRLSAYNKEGKHLWSVGTTPDPKKAIQSRERKFGLPVGLTLAPDGLLYLMDAFNGEIYIYDTNGKQLGIFGEWGREDGQFYYPAGIAAMSDERFAVADKFSDRVQVIRIPSPNVPVAMRAARYIPWFLALALLPLLALVRRRKTVFMADEAFLSRAIEDRTIESLMNTVGSLYVEPDVIHRLKASIEDDALHKILKPLKHAADKADEFKTRFGLSEEGSRLLAAKIRASRLSILTDDEALRAAAEDLEKAVPISYQEFTEALSGQ